MAGKAERSGRGYSPTRGAGCGASCAARRQIPARCSSSPGLRSGVHRQQEAGRGGQLPQPRTDRLAGSAGSIFSGSIQVRVDIWVGLRYRDGRKPTSDPVDDDNFVYFFFASSICDPIVRWAKQHESFSEWRRRVRCWSPRGTHRFKSSTTMMGYALGLNGKLCGWGKIRLIIAFPAAPVTPFVFDLVPNILKKISGQRTTRPIRAPL